MLVSFPGGSAFSVPSAVPQRSPLFRYGVALLAVAASVLVSIALRPFSYTTPFLFFFPGVLVALWYGRLGPGWFATVLSTLAANFFQLQPPGRFSLDAPNLLRSLFFCLALGVICWLIDSNRSRAEAAQAKAEAALGKTLSDLRHSQERRAAVISAAMDAIITLDQQQRIVVFNKAAENIFACAASEALGQPLDRFIPERFREAHRGHIRNFGATGVTSRSATTPATLFGLRSNGKEFPFEATISQVAVGGEKLYTVILRDITQRKQTEAALIQSEKLASVGRLAATLAHELNNPLGAIASILYMVKQSPALDPSAREYLELGEAELKQASQIIKQTLGFSKGGGNLTRFRPVEILDSVLALFERKLRARGVVFKKEYLTNSEISGVESEIRQVLWNLLNNSLEALPLGGHIRLRVSPNLRAVSVPGVRITIADTGHGISAVHLPHLFEPFFTTKDEGNGLGLWVTSAIVRKHQGSVRVRSHAAPAERTGTVFSIFLPAEAAKTLASRPSNREPAFARTEKVG